MKRYNLNSHRLHSLLVVSVLVILALGFGMSSTGLYRRNSGQQVSTPPVKNLTMSLQVVKTEWTKQGDLLVILKNGYDKAITDYQVAVGQTQIETQFTDGLTSKALAPGATQEEVYPPQAGAEMGNLTIVGVVFQDGTSDGDPQFAKEITEKHKGAEFVKTRALPMLRKALDSFDVNSPNTIGKLKSQIREIPDGRELGLSPDARAGNRHMVDYLLYRLNMLQQRDTDPIKPEAKKELLGLHKTLKESARQDK
jgi:hypothetical protein